MIDIVMAMNATMMALIMLAIPFVVITWIITRLARFTRRSVIRITK